MPTIATTLPPALGLPISLLSTRTILALAGLWLVYQVLKALYNISPLHPLSHIPGPKLAAATYLPEIYHDVILYGRYTREIERMHKKYGPLVRINPEEVHCCDINFADEIYAVGGRKRDKPIHQINGTVLGSSGFGTAEHDLHRVRRGPLAKFFSRGMIARLEGEIHDLAQRLCDKLLLEAGKKQPVDITVAYSCFTTDTITGYCFGEKFGFIDQQGWYPNFRDATASGLKPVYIFRFLPWARSLMVLGTWFVDFLPADLGLLVREMKIRLPMLVRKTKTDLDAGVQFDRPTVFGSLLQSDLEEFDKSTQRLTDEAAAVVGAGTETASWAMAIMTYHLLTKPHLLAKLRHELQQAIPDPKALPSWSTLETLPYLYGVIQEGLRLSYGVSSRTARVATAEDLVYRGEFHKKPVEYVIPRGHAVGMSAAISHHDESVFPKSHEFIPERWLDGNNQRNRELERGMLSFSKGSRACLGKNLAFCEMTLALSAVVLRVFPHMTLYETTLEDIAYDHDMFVPVPKSHNGVRVMIN